MATVTSKLTLSSSDLTSQTLSLSLSKAISASHTTGLARTKVGQTAVHSNAALLYTADDYAAIAYVYIKNTYLSEVGGLRPTGKSFRFVRACARSCM